MMENQNPNLNYYLGKNIKELITPEPYEIQEGMKERHRLYSLLLMAITRFYWNGNKEGREGEYPLNPTKYGKFEFSDYIGHNIASIAVDAYGDIIDFEFNHNKLFNSSAQQAEKLPELTCPKCKSGQLTIRDKIMKCTDDGCNWHMFRNICGVQLSLTDLQSLVDAGRTGLIKGMESKKGKKFDAYIKLDSEGGTFFTFPESKNTTKN